MSGPSDDRRDRHGQHWTVRVSGRERTHAHAYARKGCFEVGTPLSFDIGDERTSALEYLLGAVGADLVVGMKDRCHRRRLVVDNVEAVVHGELDNPLTYLGVVGEQGSPRLARVTVKLYVETLEDEADIRAAYDEMLGRSPLYQTLSAIAQFDLHLHLSM